MLPFPTRTDRTGLRFLQYHPAGNVWHCGIDFNWGPSANADKGQPVLCPTWGIVEYVSPDGFNGGLGLYVVIRHPHNGPAWTRYLHLDSVSVKVGQKVAPNEQIATLGSSGTATAHLHFEVLNENGLEFIREWKRPYGRYPTGMNKSFVAQRWLDPHLWLLTQKHYVAPDPPKPSKLTERLVKRLSRRT